MRTCRKDADAAHDVKDGQEIDGAHEVARERLEYGDGAAALLDDADLRDALARRLAMPQPLKQGEVAPMQEKWNQDQDGDRPFRACGFELLHAGKKEHRAQDQHDEGGKLQAVVDEDRDEAAAYSGERKLKRHEFGRVDAKRISVWVSIVPTPIRVAFLDGKATPSESPQVTVLPKCFKLITEFHDFQPVD